MCSGENPTTHLVCSGENPTTHKVCSATIYTKKKRKHPTHEVTRIPLVSLLKKCEELISQGMCILQQQTVWTSTQTHNSKPRLAFIVNQIFVASWAWNSETVGAFSLILRHKFNLSFFIRERFGFLTIFKCELSRSTSKLQTQHNSFYFLHCTLATDLPQREELPELLMQFELNLGLYLGAILQSLPNKHQKMLIF